MVMPEAPQLVARFVTDEQGEPRYAQTGAGRKHYRIVVEVENAPSDVVAATFELDPSYYLPVRTVERAADGRVKLETHAYGDYALKVDLRSKSARPSGRRFSAANREIWIPRLPPRSLRLLTTSLG
jgi:hypothetical protein